VFIHVADGNIGSLEGRIEVTGGPFLKSWKEFDVKLPGTKLRKKRNQKKQPINYEKYY
jgi:hypothetical protein